VTITTCITTATSAGVVCFLPELGDLPLKPSPGWLHMDRVESEKLAWMKDLQMPTADDTKVPTVSMCLALKGNVTLKNIWLKINIYV